MSALCPEGPNGSYLNDRGKQLRMKSEEACLATIAGASTLVIETAFTRLTDYTTENLLDVARRCTSRLKCALAAPGQEPLLVLQFDRVTHEQPVACAVGGFDGDEALSFEPDLPG